ncbi:SpoIID/LytB domain-containing protein [Clostridium thermarum]|uniref:SpoIID/LytB domain-containing protein n=1 Tax=Clostridium thermarum TaxID=1716543 RepID=UPI0013D88448|nr:SpoIID/LytB domain-containing protein [Clostridium thermarum]
MAIRVKSNRFYFIVAILLTSLLTILFWPRKIQHAVLVECDGKTSTFFVGERLLKYRTGSINFEKYSVLNFKRNAFKVYGFSKVDAMQERVMYKTENSYDLEVSGLKKVNEEAHYYQIDKDNKISYSYASKLIVGKSNLKIYKNKKDELKTFIMTPLDYSTIRVAISTDNFDSVYHNKIKLTARSPLKIYSKREDYSTVVPAETLISLDPTDGKIKLTINDLSREFSSRLYIEGDEIAVNSLKRLDDKTMTPVYSGIMEITPAASDLLMINEVDLEEYLTKVVPSEMPASSPLEALKCQAIAARTYAISDMLANRFAKEGYHVDDSQKSQVYNNIQAHPSTTEAVMATKGIIMTSEGMPIDAKYYSTSSGTGANYNEIYFRADGTSDPRPYLKYSSYITDDFKLPSTEEEWLDFYTRKDIRAYDSSYPYFRWNIVYPTEALSKTLNKTLETLYSKESAREFLTIKVDGKPYETLPTLTKLKDIKILRRGEAGNVITISYIFENAEVEVSGDGNIRPSIKCSEEYAGMPITVLGAKGKALTNVNSLPSSFFAIKKDGENFIIYGGGFGHGVGMSQYGAVELGKQGMSFETILGTFYKDVKLEQIY